MKHSILLKVAGILAIIFAAFHAAFPIMFNWDEGLKSLTLDNRAIMLTLHYVVIAYFLFTANICLFYTKQLLGAAVRSVVLLMLASIYVIRIIAEFVLWGFNFPSSPIILFFCIAPTFLLLYPLFSTKN